MPFQRNIGRRAAAALILAAGAHAQAGKLTPPGEIQRKNSDIVYGIAQQETLSSIALRFTGSAKNWPALAKANGIANDRTIPIGNSIVIPARLLPDKDAFATVVAMRGVVSMVDKTGEVVASRIGAQIGEGAVVVTGEDGFVTFQLKDGTSFALPPASNLQLTLLKVQDFTNRPRTALTLNKGRVTSEVTPFTLPRSQYQVQTPLAIAGVRGTRFRINFDGAGSYSEVLAGTVAVAVDAGRRQVRLPADYGSVVGGDGRPSSPVALLAPPALDGTATAQERLPVRVQLAQAPASAAAASFRVAVATDADGMRRVAEVVVKADEGHALARLPELEDGDYTVRASAIDQRGLEGREAVLTLRLKARPFAPLLRAPGSKLRGADAGAAGATPVAFEWAQVAQAAAYRLQIARDAGFTDLVDDQAALRDTRYQHAGLGEGNYYWRVASVADKNGQPDQGPWGDPAALAILPPQQMPAASQDEDGMRFSWGGAPGQRFVFESAAEIGFAHPQQHIETGEPRVSFAMPAPGTYYARVQTIEADGYRGAFSPPQKYVVERRWRTGFGGSLNSGQGPVRGD
jgi:hypothetical protein